MPKDEVEAIVPGTEMEQKLFDIYQSKKPLNPNHIKMLKKIFRDADDEIFGGKWFEQSELY